ncbi:MAG: hypothetical protein A2Z18_00510 [Armatimonadetes bacterium RBG_16_58_9]|nr:MAG: hypothetical protein A2Z18_00510 [Armatimonadetes bacterium RBG_16_58_9]
MFVASVLLVLFATAGGEASGLYYIKAEATQPNGMTGSDTTEEVAPAVGSISDAKLQPDGKLVDVVGAVTHVTQDQFWLELPDRSSGIGVIGGFPQPTRDQIVRVRGTMTTKGLEREIEAVDVEFVSSPPISIKPLAMPNRSVGGGDFEYDPSTGAGQVGAPGGNGLNNVGLLVRTFGGYAGNATASSGRMYYIIDDGSAPGVIPNIGILLDTDVVFRPNQYLMATGICGVERLPIGWIMPIIRARDANDVQVIPPVFR